MKITLTVYIKQRRKRKYNIWLVHYYYSVAMKAWSRCVSIYMGTERRRVGGKEKVKVREKERGRKRTLEGDIIVNYDDCVHT